MARPLLILGAFLAFVSCLTGQQARDIEHPDGRWEVLEGCRLRTNAPVDGDSFHVAHKGREYIFRLYFVDAPESDATLIERAQDQSAYFGIPAGDIPRAGRLAAKFTRERLTSRDLTVITRWQNAMGRSGLARFYGVVLVDGKNLAEELVGRGLARIYGLRANWPDGPRSATFLNMLKNLELTAREKRLGVWDESAFPRAKVSGSPGILATNATPTSTNRAPAAVEINTASFEELQSLPGIGPKLAERIIANRPYKNIEDLNKVPGIGSKMVERLRPLVRVALPSR